MTQETSIATEGSRLLSPRASAANEVPRPTAGPGTTDPGVVPLQVDRVVELLESVDPLLLAVGVVGLLSLVAIVTWLVRIRRLSAGEQFRRALTKPESVAVLMHPNPDPDAMASAIAVAHLAEHLGADVDLQYPGKIQHQENRAFETVLDLELEHIETRSEVTAEAVVLVDHNEPRGFPGAEGLDPYAVVDHHPGNGEGTAFTDIRTDHGACSTIIAEYFEELDAPVVNPTDSEIPDGLALPPDVATGMVYGILSDTNHLTKGASTAEFHACQFLYPGLNEETIDRIANPQVDAEVLDIKARAIQNRNVRPPYAISDVGKVENVDAIPQSADELVTLESVSAVVVYGRKNGQIHLSGRSRDDRVHMGRVLQGAVEEIPMASAGGHARMGGGQLSIDHMHGIGPSKGIEFDEFEARLFEALKGDF